MVARFRRLKVISVASAAEDCSRTEGQKVSQVHKITALMVYYGIVADHRGAAFAP